jgi:hypothetical protein
MTDERTRRVGQNEALYRLVNERIEKLSPGITDVTGQFGVVCECGSLDCRTQIMVTPQVYEQTRANSHQFIVIPGHQIDDLEAVIADHDTYLVIEKTPQDARQIAEQMDPRE